MIYIQPSTPTYYCSIRSHPLPPFPLPHPNQTMIVSAHRTVGVDLMPDKHDIARVQELAVRVAEIAALPVQEEKRAMWRSLDGRIAGRRLRPGSSAHRRFIDVRAGSDAGHGVAGHV